MAKEKSFTEMYRTRLTERVKGDKGGNHNAFKDARQAYGGESPLQEGLQEEQQHACAQSSAKTPQQTVKRLYTGPPLLYQVLTNTHTNKTAGTTEKAIK